MPRYRSSSSRTLVRGRRQLFRRRSTRVHRGVVVVGLVHAHDEGAVDVLRGSGDDDLLAPARCEPGLTVGEEAGGLNDNLNTPPQGRSAGLSEHLMCLPSTTITLVVVGDLTLEAARDES